MNTTSSQNSGKIPSLFEISESMAFLTDIGKAPSKAHMNETTWVMLAAHPNVSFIKGDVPDPRNNSIFGMKVVFDDTLPIGKIEYK